MVLLANGVPVSGSFRPVVGKLLNPAGQVAISEKLPVFSSAVGTRAEVRLPFDHTVPFLRPEEENLILLPHRATDGVAEVVAAQLVLLAIRTTRQTALFHKGVEGVQIIVTAEIIRVTVKTVFAVLGDDADLPASRLAILRAIAVALDLEFIDGVNGGGK